MRFAGAKSSASMLLDMSMASTIEMPSLRLSLLAAPTRGPAAATIQAPRHALRSVTGSRATQRRSVTPAAGRTSLMRVPASRPSRFARIHHHRGKKPSAKSSPGRPAPHGDAGTEQHNGYPGGREGWQGIPVRETEGCEWSLGGRVLEGIGNDARDAEARHAPRRRVRSPVGAQAPNGGQPKLMGAGLPGSQGIAHDPRTRDTSYRGLGERLYVLRRLELSGPDLPPGGNHQRPHQPDGIADGGVGRKRLPHSTLSRCQTPRRYHVKTDKEHCAR